MASSSSSSNPPTTDAYTRPPSPDSPIRKRARWSQAGDTMPTALSRTSMLHHSALPGEHPDIPAPVRDDTYYLSDGSCVLLVDRTLFNVHQTVLSRDHSSFSAMFPFPPGERAAEGSSDDNPIVLVGDSVIEFKNFLWALYALPHELAVVNTPMADLAKLIDITRISNKYCFKSIETWALDAIQEYINRKPSPVLGMLPSPPKYTFVPTPGIPPTIPEPHTVQQHTAQLVRLVRLAQLCNHERLLTTMVGILRQMMTLNLTYAYLAMTLADELNLKELRGSAYLEVMQRAIVVTRSEAVGQSSTQDSKLEGELDDEGRLVVTPAQRLRLLSGYYRLSMEWERLRVTPLTFEHAPSCGATWHQHGCTQSWQEFWKERSRSDAVLNLGLADVVGRFKAIQKQFDQWGSASYMHHDCRMAVKRSVQEKIQKIEDTLSDYFTDES